MDLHFGYVVNVYNFRQLVIFCFLQSEELHGDLTTIEQIHDGFINNLEKNEAEGKRS